MEKLRTGNTLLYISNHRQKFILQPYIAGLRGDYRIVVYDDKFYVLYRANRTNDFRASGSMKFNHDIELPPGLLDYAKRVFNSFDVPYIALDVSVKDGIFYLFEFQFICFGQYTLEKSKYFYRHDNSGWMKILEEPDLEREIVTSVTKFIRRH